jgi:galactokinase/mevalonate kinase-like predicted kinase
VAKRKTTIEKLDEGNTRVRRDGKKVASALVPKCGFPCRVDTVKVTAPARIDLSGGWSDTPPICYDRGGTVMVAGVTLEGVQPIEAVVSRRATSGVFVRSKDLKKRRVLKTDAEIADHSDPHDWCALVKAALTVTGYKVKDGGLEIALSSGLPKGSGMGTSSILGACTVAALDNIAGRKFDVHRVMELTLRLEQEMNTGGGWEDQMGALVPGLKILRTKAGKRQRPEWDVVADVKPFAALLKERGLLYFTGEKRMARNVLRGVISNYKADGEEGKERVAALRDGAERCFAAIKSGDWERFAACVNEYWMLKKAMDPGSTNERIEYIIARMSPWTSAVSIAGAGGGGFMFILAKSAEAKKKIVASLNRRPPVKWAKFYDFDVDEKGLTFHV